MVLPHTILADALSVLLLTIIVVFIDTLTRWTAISMKYCKDFNLDPTPWNILRCFFFKAWTKGYLESKAYKWAILIKIFAYSCAITLAVLVYLLLPQYQINGIYVGETIAILVYLAVILSELFSIAENIKDAGFERAELIKKAIEAGMQKAGINYHEEEKGDTKDETN